MTLAPRAVVVHRHTELDELLARHGTRPQAAFFLSSRGRSLEEVEARHARQQAALATVSAAIPIEWRRGQVERADLDRFLYARDDVIIVIGQDGLVANVAKYLDGQPVIGINPEPERNPGVLVPHPAEAAPALLAGVASPSLGPWLRHPLTTARPCLLSTRSSLATPAINRPAIDWSCPKAETSDSPHPVCW